MTIRQQNALIIARRLGRAAFEIFTGCLFLAALSVWWIIT